MPAHPDALARHVFVGYFSARTGRVFEVDFARGGEERSFRPRHVVAANDADAWIAAAVAGLGLIQVPCDVGVRAHLERGELRRVLPDWQVAGLPLHALWPRDKHLAARVRVFVEWVVGLYAAECRAAIGAEAATRAA